MGESKNHLDVVTGHDHLAVSVLSAFGERQVDRLISSSEVHLGTVVLSETAVATTLLLGENVERGEELGVRLDSARLGDDHTTADTTEQETRVVTGLRLVARLLEGLDIGDLGLDGVHALANNLNFLFALQNTTLDTARNDGTTTSDGEDILNSHKERLVHVTLRGGDPLIDSSEKLIDLAGANLGLLVLHCHESRAHDDRGLITLEAVRAEQLTHLHLDKLQHFRVIDSVDLVDEDNDLLDTDLTGEEQMLTGLGHLTIGSGDDNDGTVHVGGTCNHVLDVIGVARAVDVRVVAVVGRILDVSGRDGDTTSTLLGGLVNGTILEEVGQTLLGLSLGDGGGQCGLIREKVWLVQARY